MLLRARWYHAQDGSIVEQTLEAASVSALEQQLRERGEVVLGMQAVSGAASPRGPATWRGLRGLDAASWCTELRVLLHSGMTVVEAIDTMLAQSLAAGTDSASSRVIAALAGSLQQGQSLSVAMERQAAFPAVLLAGVTAGERSGALMEALDEYLRFHTLIDRLRRQVTSAAIYPALVLGIGALICTFLLLFVMPRFAAIYADMPQAASGLTAALLSVSRFLATHTAGVALLLAGLVGMGIWAWRSGAVGSALHALSEAIPGIRTRVDEYRKAQLFQSLALMFRGGYTLDEGMQRCAAMGLGPRLTEAVEAARNQVMAGVAPAEALSHAGLLDEVSVRLIRVGERAGNFDRVLSTIAERHAQRFGTTVERVTRLAEPLLLLFVALAVGTLVVLLYIPVFDMAGSVR